MSLDDSGLVPCLVVVVVLLEIEIDIIMVWWYIGMMDVSVLPW